MNEDLRKEYKKFQVLHFLPDYDKLNQDFGVESIEKGSFLLNDIRIKITEKIEHFAKMMEEILQPDSNLSNLYEFKFIDDNEKTKIYKIFKELMKNVRYSNEISLLNEEKENAKFIKLIYKDWQSKKIEFQKIFKLLKNSWDIETDIKEDLSYLG